MEGSWNGAAPAIQPFGIFSNAQLLYYCMYDHIYIYENPYGDMIGKYAGNLMECGYDGNMLQILYFL